MKEKYKNVIQKSVFLLLMILVISNISYKETQAASASITFSSKTPKVEKGDTFSVVLTVKSSATVGDVEAYVSYDPEIMKFETGGAFIHGGDGLLKISDINTEYSNTTKKYSMKFKAVDVGSCEVGISDSATVYDYDAGTEMSVSSDRLSITVASTKKLSSNNKLKSMNISPGTLMPQFSKDIVEYTTTVSGDTDKLFVSAVPSNSEATVSVKGNENLITGDNLVKISVQAPSGDIKDYTILVKKDAFSPSNSPSPSADAGTTDITVTKENGAIFIQKTYKYQILKLTDDTLIPDGYHKTKLVLSDITINAYTNKNNDLDSEFLLIYAKNENGDIGFYQYDRIEKTLQRYNSDSVSNKPVTSTTDVPASSDNTKVKQLSYVIAILCALCAFLMICVIRYYLKLRGFDDDDIE